MSFVSILELEFDLLDLFYLRFRKANLKLTQNETQEVLGEICRKLKCVTEQVNLFHLNLLPLKIKQDQCIIQISNIRNLIPHCLNHLTR